MMILTIQYLENNPNVADLNVKQVVQKLRRAGEVLPITHVLIGWHLPAGLEEACRKECERISARFLRWHPLLTGDAEYNPKPCWQVVGLSGARVKGYHNMPEFTFVCPNNQEAKEENLQHIRNVIEAGVYDGFFLDRVRFPSPARDPNHSLGCFCTDCKRAAQLCGFDLTEVQQLIANMAVQKKGALDLVRALFGRYEEINSKSTEVLRQFFLFRSESITKFIADVSKLLREKKLEIGLDCFAPSLTYMVGQNLKQLGHCVDWIKVMTYAHAMGPAGMPFEALGILEYLISTMGMDEKEAIAALTDVMQLSLPETCKGLQKEGFSSQALGQEVERGKLSTTTPILAGIELVELKGVSHLQKNRMEEDFMAVKKANPAGVSISWDLELIPLDRLELFKNAWWQDSYPASNN